MFLRAAKTEAEEAGESTEGMASSVSELRQEILDLTGQRVDIQIDDDTFKSTYQILQELSEVWDDLTDVSQANILEMVGGKRNANVVSALIEDFSIAEKALQTASNAAGSALAENEKHLSSIEGKISKFKAAWQALSQTIVNSDLVKVVVDIGTAMVKAADSAANFVGATGALALSVPAVVALEKKFEIIKDTISGIQAGANAFVGIFTNSRSQFVIDGLAKAMGGLNSSQLETLISTRQLNVAQASLALQKAGVTRADRIQILTNAGLITSNASLGVSIKSVTTALLAQAKAWLATPMGMATAAAIGIFAIVKLVDHFTVSVDESREALVRLKEEYNENESELASLNSELQTTADRIAELQEQDTLTFTEAEELENLKLQNAELEREIALREIIKKQKAEEQNKTFVETMEKDLANAKEYGTTYKYASSNYTPELTSVSGPSMAVTTTMSEKDLMRAALMKRNELYEAWAAEPSAEEREKLESSINEIEVYLTEKIQELNADAEGISYISNPTTDDEKAVNEWLDFINDFNDQMLIAFNSDGAKSNAFDRLIYGSFSDTTNELKELGEQGLVTAEHLSDTRYNDFIAKCIELGIIAGESDDDLALLASGFNELGDAAGHSTEEVEAARDAMRKSVAESLAPKTYESYMPGTTAHFNEVEKYTERVSEYQDKLRELSDEELQFVYDLVVNGDVDSWEEALEKLEWFNSEAGKAEMSWGTYGAQLSTILESGDIANISSEITTLTNALTSLSDGSIGVSDVVELVQQFPELAEYVDFTADNFGNLEDGLKSLIRSSPDEFVKTLQEFKTTNNLTGEAADQIDALCDSVNNLSVDALRDASGEFGVLADAINAAKTAQDELEKALQEEDWDAGYEGRVKAFEGFSGVYEAGEYGSKAYAAYKEYFGLIEKTPEQIGVWMESNKKYFTEGTDGVLAFLETIEKLGASGGSLDGIASFSSVTGEFWYDINQLDAFADALGWTEEMLQDFIYKYRMYCEEWTSRSAQDNLTEFTNAGLVFDIGSETFASLDKLKEYTALSKDGVLELITAINELRAQQGLGAIQIIGSDQITITQETVDNLLAAGETAENVKALLIELNGQDNVTIEAGIQLDGQSVSEMLAEATGDGSEVVNVDVVMNVNDEEVIATVTTTADQIRAILGDGWEAKITGDTVDAEERIAATNELLENLPENTVVTVSDVTSGVRSNLQSVKSYLQYIGNNNVKTVTIRYRTEGVTPYATGTKKAKRGMALLGDEYSANGKPKPELVVSGNRAYVAGTDGPEIGYLNDGDVVYTADETKRILNGASVDDGIPAFAGGTASGLKANGGLASGGGYNYSKTTSSSSSKKSSSSSKKSSSSNEESWFEKQYKYHQHLIAMDKESVAAYLKWLDSAYQKAYNQGIIDLDEYYSYQEEVYTGLQDLFKDYLNDIDHEISMLDGIVGSSSDVISMAKEAMDAIEDELAAARAAGLDENGEYIQYLEQQWKGYSDTVTDLREKAEADAKSSVDELVQYRIKMLEREAQSEKEVLNKKLDDLQKFYDEQRKMLQDQYDEEKYLEEQSEKRKSVSDIRAELAMLANDDSAWAQKRKLELQAELSSAEKDLSDFEKDHALESTLDLLEKQQAEQEAQIQAEMDALEEKLNDPHALFNQALEDIKNNTAELYQEFIEYNRKYGTGNDADISEMFEEAYKADQEYKDTHGGASKDGIEIGNYTGYVAPTPSTPPGSSTPESSTPTAPSGGGSSTPSTSKPSLSKGSTIRVKKSATHFSSKSGNARMASFVPGGKYTVYQTSGSQVLIGRNGVYTGWIKKSDIVGYKSGTKHSIEGLARFDEDGKGSEYIFESSDGSRYRMFSEGSKVLNAESTNFLYDFATSGGQVLTKMISELLGLGNIGNIVRPIQTVDIRAGDIIVQGNATERTVSEIRRAQRESLEFVIKEFNKLNR